MLTGLTMTVRQWLNENAPGKDALVNELAIVAILADCAPL